MPSEILKAYFIETYFEECRPDARIKIEPKDTTRMYKEKNELNYKRRWPEALTLIEQDKSLQDVELKELLDLFPRYRWEHLRG